MNQFGTNINDYIWYIVGGIALFFILVGFIADKSGLAKKTFSKNTTNSKKKEDLQNNSVMPIVDSNNVSAEEIHPDEDVAISDAPDFITEDYNSNNEDIDVQPLVQEDVIVDDIHASNDLAENSSDLEQSEEPADHLETAYLDIDEPISDLQDSSDEQQVEFPDLETEENVSVATDNAEDDWGIDIEKNVDSNDELEDIELPKLEDLNADEEDVWKF